MRTLVTGANGHIGCHVVRAALAAGHEVRALVRPGSDRRGLAGQGVELVEGDLLDGQSVARAAKGMELVLHVGAVHRMAAADPESITRPAITGTANVLDAAREAAVRRVVLTSSGATVGFAKDPEKPLDESAFFEGARGVYTRGKVESEKLALAAAAAGDLDVVVVNPTGVFGPLDFRLTPAMRALVGLVSGDPAFMSVCATHVADVGRAHVLAAEKGASGERYLIAGDQLAPKEVAALVGSITGVTPSTFRPPQFLLRWLVGRAEKKAIANGTDTGATVDAVRDLAGGHLAYDAGKSKRVLGMTYRPAREVLSDAYRWLLHIGALPDKAAARMRATSGKACEPDPGWPPFR